MGGQQNNTDREESNIQGEATHKDRLTAVGKVSAGGDGREQGREINAKP